MPRNTTHTERSPLLTNSELKEWKQRVPESETSNYDHENSLENLSFPSHFDNSSNTRIHGAEIHVHGNEKIITSSTNGEYWRLLLPGKYQMEVRYPTDYLAFSEVKEVEVTENQVTRKDFTIYMR